MRSVQTTYEIVDEFPQMCAEFIAANSEQYGQVDPNWFRMMLIATKDRPLLQQLPFKLVQLSNPVAQFGTFRFVVVTWKTAWDAFGEAGRRAMVAEVVRSACSPN